MSGDLLEPGRALPDRPSAVTPPSYRLWVNADRTVLVRIWSSGVGEVALRDDPSHTWGPPVYVKEDVS